MLIDFGSTSNNFIIDFWFHPDLLYQKSPPTQTSYLFLTESHQILYDASLGKYRLGVLSGGNFNYFDLNDSPYMYGWNHLILHNQPTTSGGNTNLLASLSNNFFKSNSLIATVAGSVSMRYICFCNIDTGTNCCGLTTSITWMDMWMTELRVWDGAFATVWSVIQAPNL